MINFDIYIVGTERVMNELERADRAATLLGVHYGRDQLIDCPLDCSKRPRITNESRYVVLYCYSQ